MRNLILILLIASQTLVFGQLKTPLSNAVLLNDLQGNDQDILNLGTISLGPGPQGTRRIHLVPNGSPTSPADGIGFGNDVTLYRSSNGTLTLNGNLIVTGTLNATSGNEANLQALKQINPLLDNFIVGTGTGWVGKNPAQVRAALGLKPLATADFVTSAYIADGTITSADLAPGVVLANLNGGSGTLNLSGYSITYPSNPTFNGIVSVENSIVFKGSAGNPFKTTLTAQTPTADRTIILPNASGTVALVENLPSNSQPLDPDLVAIAALSTTSYGRELLTLPDSAALRAYAGLVIGTHVQAWDADLNAIAALPTTSYGRGLLTLQDPAALRANAGLVIGTHVQAWDADLNAIAALPTTSYGRGLLTLQDPAALRANAGLVIGTNVQAWDNDLEAIAALSTTSYGRELLTLADAATLRNNAGLVIGTDVQAWDSDLDEIAVLSTTSYGRELLTLADAAALRTYAGLVIGTNVQAWDNDLEAIAFLSTTSYGRGLLTQADAAALRTYAGLVIGTDVQAWDADLDEIADLSTTSYGRELLTLNNAAALRTYAGLVIGTDVQAWSSNLDTWATKVPPTGDIVGTTSTQTLTNKTLTSPVINSPKIRFDPKSANFVAEAFGHYATSGNLTVSDPSSPVVGHYYVVLVQSGTATIGGTPYSPSSVPIYRYYNGSSWITLAVPSSMQVVVLKDIKPQNTEGQTLTTDAWNTRHINTEEADTANICTLSNNQFTLPAGTYQISATITTGRNSQARSAFRLRNVSDATNVLFGNSVSHDFTGTAHVITSLAGVFTISSSKTFEIQQYPRSIPGLTSSYVGGYPADVPGVSECYLTAIIIKIQ